MISLPAKILIAMPTYNNQASALVMIQSLAKLGFTLLVVDDGSEVALPSQTDLAAVTIIRYQRNHGKGHALRAAFQWARERGFTHVITVDADGQHLTGDVARLAVKARELPGSLIIGKRDMDAPSAGFVPGSSRFGRDFSDFWIAMESGGRVSDSQSGLRCYPLADLPDRECWSNRYDFEVEIITRWLWRGGNVASETVSVYYPECRVTSFRPFVDNVRISWLHTRLCCLRLLGAGILFNKKQKSQEVSGAGFLSQLIKWLGPGFCYALLPLVVFFYWLAAASARANLMEFYRHIGITGFKAHKMTYKNILAFAFGIVDRAAYAMGRVEPLVASLPSQFSADGAGSVMLGAHFGDWSFAGKAFGDKHGRPVLIAVNQKINPKMQSITENALKNRLMFIDLGADRVSTMLTCKDVMDRGGYICFMADRVGAGEEQIIEVTLLGEIAKLPKNIFRMAKAFQRPVKFFYCARESLSGWPKYKLTGITLWDGVETIDGAELAPRYSKALEEAVLASPHNWFNFHDFWSNARVKTDAEHESDSRQLKAHA